MTNTSKRPLSPHLQIYKPQLTSMMSILHRATGLALVYGLVMIIWMLVAAATSAEAFVTFTNFCNSFFGQLLLFGWSFALYYHMCNGVRHLIWDTGHLFAIEHAYKAGYVVLATAFGLTAWTWL